MAKQRTQEEWAAYNLDCEEKRKHCIATDHDWRVMDWQEAYPASSGKVCKHCDLYQLGW